jgi:beta-phosphoglucomutase-like phosphatase (HAD superfamily)
VSIIRAILFDHDGTLVDSEPVHYEMWEAILHTYGIDLEIEEYKQHYAGIPTTSNATRIVHDYPSLATTASALVTAKNFATQKFLSREAFPLTVGAKEALGYFFKQNLKIAIVTGAGIDGVKATIRSYNLQEYVKTVVSGDDVKCSKPSPDGYILATQRLKVESFECIAIEDTENGVNAAAKANVPCVAVPSAMSKNHNFSNAIKILGSLKEATGWITSNYEFIPCDR